MHDDLLERRLQAALHDEAAALPLTITAAELQRRAALRGRMSGNRRLTLLLAAAVAVAGVAAGGLMGGLFRVEPTPNATDPNTALTSASPRILPPTSPPATMPTDGTLPSLDDLVAVDPETVLIAQAHGPADGAIETSTELPDAPPDSVSLGTVFGPSEFRIALACLGGERVSLGVRELNQRASILNASVACDGTLVEHRFRSTRPAEVTLESGQPASWRIVVRGTRAPVPLPTENPVIPAAASEDEELLRVDGGSVDLINPWSDGAMRIELVSVVPMREAYSAQVWCPWGPSLRLVLGAEINGVLTPDTETHVACDGTIRSLDFGSPTPMSRGVYVAGQPLARFSLLVTSKSPPVAVWRDLPGWRVNTAEDPFLSYVSTSHDWSSIPVVGGSRYQVLLACVGPAPVEVNVALGEGIDHRRETFTESCGPNGSLPARHEFETDAPRIRVTYTTPPGTWSALTILVPDP